MWIQPNNQVNPKRFEAVCCVRDWLVVYSLSPYSRVLGSKPPSDQSHKVWGKICELSVTPGKRGHKVWSYKEEGPGLRCSISLPIQWAIRTLCINQCLTNVVSVFALQHQLWIWVKFGETSGVNTNNPSQQRTPTDRPHKTHTTRRYPYAFKLHIQFSKLQTVDSFVDSLHHLWVQKTWSSYIMCVCHAQSISSTCNPDALCTFRKEFHTLVIAASFVEFLYFYFILSSNNVLKYQLCSRLSPESELAAAPVNLKNWFIPKTCSYC